MLCMVAWPMKPGSAKMQKRYTHDVDIVTLVETWYVCWSQVLKYVWVVFDIGAMCAT